MLGFEQGDAESVMSTVALWEELDHVLIESDGLGDHVGVEKQTTEFFHCVALLFTDALRLWLGTQWGRKWLR